MINIAYLLYRRLDFSKLCFLTLGKTRNKNNIHISIYGNQQDTGQLLEIQKEAEKHGLKSSVYPYPSLADNYMTKLNHASSQDYEYSIKLDEDIFMSAPLWDYFIDNIPNVLQDDRNLVFTSTISSGIPSCDYFMEYIMDEPGREEMKRRFTCSNIPNIWGADYTALNNYVHGGRYISDEYYQIVSGLPHFYKGIHPIRVDLASQQFMNHWISVNSNKFFNVENWFYEPTNRPYFCNSFFAIKTKTWRTILGRKDLARDPFDEVTLNLYRHSLGLNIVFIKNGFGIHTMYNTLYADIGHPQQEIDRQERELVDTIYTKAKTIYA